MGGLFANLRCRIDRLHWKNHCACVEAYDLDRYSGYNVDIEHFNSEANEQVRRLFIELNIPEIY